MSAASSAVKIIRKVITNRKPETVLTNPRTVLRTARKTKAKTKKVPNKDAILVTLKTQGKSPITRPRRVPKVGGERGLSASEKKEIQTRREVTVTKKPTKRVVKPAREKLIVQNDKKMRTGRDPDSDIFPEEDIPKVKKFDGVPQARPKQRTIDERIEAGGEQKPKPSASKEEPRYDKEVEDRAKEGIKLQESPSAPKPKKGAKPNLQLTKAQKEDALLRRLIMVQTKKRNPTARLTPAERRDLRLLRKIKSKKVQRTVTKITKPKGDLAVSRYKAYQQPDLKKPLPPK